MPVDGEHDDSDLLAPVVPKLHVRRVMRNDAEACVTAASFGTCGRLVGMKAFKTSEARRTAAPTMRGVRCGRGGQPLGAPESTRQHAN